MVVIIFLFFISLCYTTHTLKCRVQIRRMKETGMDVCVCFFWQPWRIRSLQQRSIVRLVIYVCRRPDLIKCHSQSLCTVSFCGIATAVLSFGVKHTAALSSIICLKAPLEVWQVYSKEQQILDKRKGFDKQIHRKKYQSSLDWNKITGFDLITIYFEIYCCDMETACDVHFFSVWYFVFFRPWRQSLSLLIIYS